MGNIDKKLEQKIEHLKKRCSRFEEQIDFLKLKIESIKAEIKAAEKEKESNIMTNLLKNIKNAGYDINSSTMDKLLESLKVQSPPNEYNKEISLKEIDSTLEENCIERKSVPALYEYKKDISGEKL